MVCSIHAAGHCQGCGDQAMPAECRVGMSCMLRVCVGLQLSEGGVCCFLKDILYLKEDDHEPGMRLDYHMQGGR